ncbi:MAG TPA: rhodanese-like domain-containing protein [Bacteroidota bacterium]|nr:rhodanese-like domain-containing protein [Bacteroidota bacterium]
MTRFDKAWREGLAIAICSVVFGFSYTFVQEKGLFAKPASRRATLGTVSAAPSVIEIQEALSLFQSGEAVFVDSRHGFDYKLGHIRGALNLPLEEFDTKADVIASLPRNKILITYCDGADCNSSIELATKLMESGFTSVKVFFAGWNEWQGQRLPMAVTQ